MGEGAIFVSKLEGVGGKQFMESVGASFRKIRESGGGGGGGQAFKAFKALNTPVYLFN
jgi:hypothetical protein